MYWYCSGSKSWPTLDTIISFVFANLISMNCDLIGVLICVCSIPSTGEHMWGPRGRQWGREHRWKVREKKNKLETTSTVRSPQAQTDNCWKLSALIGPDLEGLNILQKPSCRDQEGRKWSDEVVPGTSVFPSVRTVCRGTFGVTSRVKSSISHFKTERGTSLETL